MHNYHFTDKFTYFNSAMLVHNLSAILTLMCVKSLGVQLDFTAAWSMGATVFVMSRDQSCAALKGKERVCVFLDIYFLLIGGGAWVCLFIET